ncbi:uncharacterized protein FA14DRAFT_72596 [Meira miltonrushii]|uniref:HIT-type domain-containing protein n=1 Tax=Meira miltonrushii TaxID=1280837 RepID=A0A316VEN5_9BASI|nr:uncharacterized protein FA14DRAFT_72596 [Meira miltonrushii]PWN34451.1 hypothetical protein FA14DRAFT_72596 [Meira miltonrushii]
MSAAISKACIVCRASSSKYKCPKCTSPTCSLICSKKHKSDVHPDIGFAGASTSSDPGIQACSASITDKEELLPSLRQFSNASETITAPNANNFGNIDKFIPMNAYGEANMMEDFEYLQFMGRSIATLGKDLIKKGWYKDSDQDNDAKNPSGSQGGRNSRPSSKNQGGRFNTSTEKLSSEARNRQQYEQSIRKLKVPIMLLPDGMSARKENQSRYKVQQQQLMCTVQISFPCGKAEDRRSKRVIQHHIPWNRSIEETVRSEMEKRLRVKATGQNVENDSDQSVSAWEALFGTQREGNDEAKMSSFEDIRNQVMIVIPVHSEKLRNETSARFLEWWQRQVRNGMVLEGGLKFDEEKKLSLEKKRNGEWAPIEGLATEEVEKEGLPELIQGATQNTSMESAEQSGLISSFLLNRLQSQRVMQKKRELEAVNSETQDDISQHHDANTPQKEISRTATRHLVVLQGKETIEDILRRLAKGYAIVEYPHIEVWESSKLSQKFADGSAERVRLSPVDGEVESGDDEATAAMEKNVAKRSAAVTLDNDSSKKIKVDTGHPPKASTSALVGLSAYASSDEDSEGDAEVDNESRDISEEAKSNFESYLLEQIASDAPNGGGLANIARSLGMI